jgi:hypothetical protein
MSKPSFASLPCYPSGDRASAYHPPLNEVFLTVDPDELGFALTLFVSAANQQICLCGVANADFLEEGRRFISSVPGHNLGAPAPSAIGFARQSSLEAAFFALWQHYPGDDLRRSLCARVLGFYFLMERTRGQALQDWMEFCPDNPTAVILHPAVVDALAIIPLNSAGVLDQRLLLHTINLIAMNAASA